MQKQNQTNKKNSIHKTNESVGGYSKPSCSKTKHICNLDIAEFLISNNSQKVLEFTTVAQEYKEVGKKDLANFIYFKPGESLQEFVDTTWKIHNTSSAIARAREETKLIDLICSYLKRECCPGCDKIWYKSAIEVLSRIKIHPIVYATALHELLIPGRGKF